MHGHIPDRGFEDTITGATGEAHQAGDAGIVPPQANGEQAVGQGFAHPPHRPPTPAHRFQQLLQFHQVKGMTSTEHQGQLIVGTGAETGLLAVLLKQRRSRQDEGGGHHKRANPFSCSSASWA